MYQEHLSVYSNKMLHIFPGKSVKNPYFFNATIFEPVLRIRIRIRIRSDPGFMGHPDPDPDPGKKFTDPDPSSTIIFKSQNNGI